MKYTAKFREHLLPAAGTQYFAMDVDEVPAAGGSRPDRVSDVSWSQEGVQRHFVEQLVEPVRGVGTTTHDNTQQQQHNNNTTTTQQHTNTPTHQHTNTQQQTTNNTQQHNNTTTNNKQQTTNNKQQTTTTTTEVDSGCGAAMRRRQRRLRQWLRHERLSVAMALLNDHWLGERFDELPLM